MVDFSKVKIDFDQKSKQLKMERIKLLQEKIKEKTGKDVKINLFEKEKPNEEQLNLNTIINQPFKAGVGCLIFLSRKILVLNKFKLKGG